MVEGVKLLEEKLREAACFGDIKTVKQLLDSGVNVNSQNEVNGWSALHWAAHRNYRNVVDLLLNYGADKSSLTLKGESPCSLTTNTEIQVLLEGKSSVKEKEKLPITPSYLVNPALLTSNCNHIAKCSPGEINCISNFYEGSTDEEIVLKLRLANSSDLDFIEIELPKNELTFNKLVKTCCEELNIKPDVIMKIRKLPDTVLRKDKDVKRLKNFQEIEVVLSKIENSSVAVNESTSVISSRNQYESISLKKDQVVLY